MKCKSFWLYVITSLMMVLSPSAYADYIFKNGSLLKAEFQAILPVQEHFDLGIQALQNSNWAEAEKQFRIVTVNFPASAYAQEGYFYLGLAEFNQDELDFANEAFSNYIKSKNNPKFFQDAIQYKFEIAEKLANGSRRRFLGTKKLPKWATGRTLALKIYDEVIAALPSNDLAARALYAKGCLQWQLKNYRQAIDDFQLVIRRFPKHELAPECYVSISKIFVDQSESEFQNPDILAFAEINLRRFKQEYPREERIVEVEKDIMAIKEFYALGLYETGRFYERTDKPKASIIYYQKAIKQFPETKTSLRAKERLDQFRLQKKVDQPLESEQIKQ